MSASKWMDKVPEPQDQLTKIYTLDIFPQNIFILSFILLDTAL